jgi:hypothetical protein
LALEDFRFTDVCPSLVPSRENPDPSHSLSLVPVAVMWETGSAGAKDEPKMGDFHSLFTFKESGFSRDGTREGQTSVKRKSSIMHAMEYSSRQRARDSCESIARERDSRVTSERGSDKTIVSRKKQNRPLWKPSSEPRS